MNHILSLAAGTLPEFQPEQVARAAGQAGFTHCGFTIEPDKWNAEALAATKAAIADHALSVLDVEVVWIPEGGKLTDDHRRIIDAGLELGAVNVLVVSSEPDHGRTAEALHQLCTWGAPGNMRVALEFLMITAVQSMDSALDIIRKADHPAAALLIDTIHFQRAGHRPAQLEELEASLLPYTQICDGNVACESNFEAYLEDAIDLRSCPGEGALPVADIIKALPKAIPLSLEIRSKIYRKQFPDATERAAAVHKASLAYLQQNGVQVR
ncbi:MAG: sugar phosphate isomerase/epimerase [Sphingomonadales bacterium]|nr:sugar phosphate isomerase/epimerase [Sphingomonadales bacterium]NCO47530.1 sugar phosphate isomerase/epimerase [Sphingomonadales bacterium]NCP00656.1 sugar phosphate isomerase/epimerase [Sphingomonadales bacterium]NCP25476.1 sugar phosphate isomerase/epimerase [Sphingomonadales bacterium]NCP44685.1 sugar phosphate isomerase/epimerase [Sphingomonadales bacterium]